MSVLFKARAVLRRRRWRRYWIEQDGRNHIEFYRTLAAEWRARDTTPTREETP